MRTVELLRFVILLVAFMPPSDARSGAPTPTPNVVSSTYLPGPDSTRGSVVFLGASEIVLRSAASTSDIHVGLGEVRRVWKEVDVPASAIEPGDDVSVNGTRMTDDRFLARYIWVNIGRLDARIVRVAGDELIVESRSPPSPGQLGPSSAQETRLALSPYLEIIRIEGSREVPATRADLRAGRVIGAVTYRPRIGPPRATRIWLGPD